MTAPALLISALKAVLGILVITGGWLLVQVAWRRVFPGVAPDEDVLAGRIGCHDCPRDSSCHQPNCEAGGVPAPTNPRKTITT